MKSFSRGGQGGGFGKKRFGGQGFGGRGGFQKKGGFSRGNDGGLHEATCSGCGGMALVPFRPVEGRPVFCKNCFKKEEGDFEPKRFSRPERSSAPATDTRVLEQLKAIQEKLDIILESLSE
jgi:CxxC-x17-CxxC domain-containing protein